MTTAIPAESSRTESGRAPSMTLWRLELLRTVRTHRWMLVFGVYAFFGVTGPLLARYLEDIISSFGGGEVTITAAEPRAIDGIMQFVGNGSQLGLLAVIVLSASALALDAHPEFAAFLRTKVSHAGTLLVPRYVVATATSVAALALGTGLAWAVTVPLLGGLPVAPMLIGTLLGALYLAFAVSVVAAMASFIRSIAGTVFASLAVLIVLPIIGLAPDISPWLPSELLAAVGGLVEGAPASDYVRSTLVTILLTVALVLLAAHRVERREQ
jgi:ABC-2 type transport system permease protein